MQANFWSIKVPVAAERDIDLVVQARFFPGVNRGVLVEVGAAEPDYLSIGASFRKLGWSVVAIEPNPEFCELHRALGHEVLQYACSDVDQDDVDFYVVNLPNAEYLDGRVSAESYSSLGIRKEFSADLAKVENKTSTEIKVKVRRLDTILGEHHPELDVMRGLTFGRYRPKVVIAENLFRSRTYRRFMRKLGYRRWKRLKPNEIYVRRDVAVGVWERITGSFS